MKRKNIIYLLISLSAFIISCLNEELEKEILMGTSETLGVEYITATLKGEILDFGEGVDQYGHCWSVNEAPTMNDDITIIKEHKDGEYLSYLNDLKDNTIYYYRSYAKNGSKILYGDGGYFKTKAYQRPEISILSINNITGHSMNIDVTISDFGGCNSLQNYGVCWNESGSPTFVDNCKSMGELGFLSGSEEILVESLDSLKRYYVRAFAVNEKGISYSDVITVRTGVVVSGGMIAYYPFDGDAYDKSGSNYHGSVYGATLTTDRFGSENSAMIFDGVNDFILVENFNDLGTGDFTVSAWVNSETTSGDRQYIVCKGLTSAGEPSYGGFGLRMNLEYINNAEFGLGDKSSEVNRITDIALTTNSWHLMVGVRSGTYMYLYVDGELVASGSTSHIYNIDTNIELSIGAIYKNMVIPTAEFFNGSIDDIRIYNRALSAKEIESLYHENNWE